MPGWVLLLKGPVTHTSAGLEAPEVESPRPALTCEDGTGLLAAGPGVTFLGIALTANCIWEHFGYV